MIIAIIQARMGSTRLPGKVLKIAAGKPILAHQILRVKKAKTLDLVVIATTITPADDSIIRLSKKYGVSFFRGSGDDVLDRYYQAAKKFGADTIVRLTGDCPLLDPGLIDKAVRFFKKGHFDYAANGLPPTLPDGMDVEVFTFRSLEAAWKKARLASDREHVTSYIWKNPKKFRIGRISEKNNLSHLRLTVDEPSDLRLVRKIFNRLYKKNKYFSLDDILGLLEENPRLLRINSAIVRNEGYSKSIKEDKKKR
jgi:spore coat polysaccharide biosynthesis protein SpsF